MQSLWIVTRRKPRPGKRYGWIAQFVVMAPDEAGAIAAVEAEHSDGAFTYQVEVAEGMAHLTHSGFDRTGGV